MFTHPRISHIRYVNHQIVDKSSNCDFTRIVTVAWNFHPEKNILTYGATVYTPSDNKDKWVKKHHTERAITRYEKTPVIIRFENEFDFSRVAMDRYIADDLTYRFGVKSQVLDYVNKFIGNEFITRKYDPGFHILLRDAIDRLDNNRPSRTCSFPWIATLSLPVFAIVANYVTMA